MDTKLNTEELWIKTFTGQKVWLEQLNPDAINILDIAVSLSRIPRWAGHTEIFYSVAQHSVRCARSVPKHLRMQALLHDATEAFIGDIPGPVKKLIPGIKEFETRLFEMVAKRFNIDPIIHEVVKAADVDALNYEFEILMNSEKNGDQIILGAMSSDQAALEFLKTYFQIQQTTEDETHPVEAN